MLVSGMKTITTLVQVRPRDRDHYRQLPIFGCLLDDFVPWAFSRGYTIHTVYLQLDAVRHVSTWFRRRGRRSITELTADDLAAAHRCFATQRRDPRYAWGLHGFIAFLKTQGCLKPGRPKTLTHSEQEVARFMEHLRKDRGAADSTRDMYQRRVLHFLKFVGFDRRKMAIKTLTLTTVHRYLHSFSGQCNRNTMQHVVGSLRGFLRYEFMRGVLDRPLHTQIDTVRIYRDEHLPYPVQWSELQQLFRRVDRSTPLGARDYAVLLLAATYGLRASDVANLTLDAIDWSERTIQIVQCKTRQPLSLPLTHEVGAAVADYLRRARPTASCRWIFLRRCAPIGRLSLPGMSQTLRRASQSAGVSLKVTGFRCLRHALALRLLRQGASVKDIGDIFGHRSTLSTAIYLRLNVEDLRPVALPVPGQNKSEVLRPSPVPGSSTRWRSGARTAPLSWGWRSFFKKSMADYLAIQRALGRDYETPERTLRGLDFFLVRHYPKARSFTAPMFAAWAAGLHQLCPTTARMRMLCVRKFCCHVARSHSAMFIPDLRTFPKELPHQAPYLLSESEVARLLAATTTLRATRNKPLHPQTIRLAFLLLFCCGLRRGEVLKLRLTDIDTETMVLRINETKFYKSRLVPLSPSVADELRQYLAQRRRTNMPMEPTAPLVWNGYPRRNGQVFALTSMPFWANWQRVCRCAQVFNHRGRPPRIHDLRHSFAVEALRRAYNTGQNTQAVLPRLARYMGHAGIQFTHYYLKFTEPLRCVASDRFRHHLAAAILPTTAPKEGGAS
jgi:site-specific recombinase XerD